MPKLLSTLHAAEHALIAMLPLWAMCDRWDIGGLSTNLHPDTGRPTIFVYDGHPGGVGITERGFEQFEGWVADTARMLASCPCTDGCPSCVQSPKCGNLNEMLDKAGARLLLERLSSCYVSLRTAACSAERAQGSRERLPRVEHSGVHIAAPRHPVEHDAHRERGRIERLVDLVPASGVETGAPGCGRTE